MMDTALRKPCPFLGSGNFYARSELHEGVSHDYIIEDCSDSELVDAWGEAGPPRLSRAKFQARFQEVQGASEVRQQGNMHKHTGFPKHSIIWIC